MSSSIICRLQPIVRRLRAGWRRSMPAWRFRPSSIWMGDPGRSRPLLVVLALFALAAVQLGFPDSPQTLPAAGGGRAKAAEDRATAVTEWPAILERPLFAPNRRPVKADEAAPSVLDGYLVLGIGLMRPAATAVVKTPGGKPTRLVPGQRLDGWTLTMIEPKRLIFQRDGEKRILLFDARLLRAPPGRPGERTTDPK